MSETILIALRRIIRAVDRHSHKLASTHGLTGPQALLLTEIVRDGPLTGSQLAARVSLSQATVTDVVHRLEGRNLVIKQRSDVDRRQIMLEATADGEALVKQSVPLLQERFLQRLDGLRDWERAQLLASLQRVAELMDAEDIEAAPLLTSGAITASAEAVEEAIAPKPRR